MRFFTLILLLASYSISAQSSYEDLQVKIERHLASDLFRASNITLSIVDIESQELLASHRPHKVLTPASSLKLLTTMTGLHTLGSSYRFETKIYYKGKIQADGTLKGDIIIKGGGDPTLGSTKFDEVLGLKPLVTAIITSIQKAGITCIDGKVIADESIFDSYPIAPTWQWNDLGNYYATGAWGINVTENQYAIHFDKRDKIGTRPRIHSTYPNIPKLNLSNEITVDSAHTGDQAYIFGGPYNYYKRIVGTIPQGSTLFTIKGSIPDPPMFLAYRVSQELTDKKIKNQGYETSFESVKVSETNHLLTLQSPTLSKIVRRANFESNNLYTEAILKMIGLKKRGMGSGQNGINIVRKELKKASARESDQIIMDGSGLSARNKVSSYALAKFLSALTNKLEIEKIIKYLPRGGYSGTVKSMFSGSKAKGNVWLKSGSMESVQSYTGVVRAKSGKWISFCIIVNGYSAKGKVIRSKLDKLIRDIYFYC